MFYADLIEVEVDLSEQTLSSDAVKARATDLGFELVGICDAQTAPHLAEYDAWLKKGYHGSMDYLAEQRILKEHPSNLLPGARSIIAVGLNYNRENPYIPGEARFARYALGRDYHKVLRGKLKALARFIESENPEAKCRPCVDSAPIFERDFAHLAGLGWFGKNTMLINSRRGSWFFLGLLLTTQHFQPDAPALGGCGTCRRCIDACPTGAIVVEEDRWQVDARRCISYLTIEHRGEIAGDLKSKIGTWTFGCDICQEVCPFNTPRSTQPERAAITQEPDFQWPHRRLPLQHLEVIQREEWDALTQGSAIRRTGLDGLRRNAQINRTNRPNA